MTGRTPARLAIVLALAAMPSAPAVSAPTGDATRTRVIVELPTPPALAAVARAGKAASLAWARAEERAELLEDDQRQLVALAERNGIEIDVVHRLTAAYNGLVVELPEPDADALSDLPGIRAVHADTSYTTTLRDSVPLIGAPEVWDLADPAGQPATGTGMVVAVLDSGIDYRHPDLGGGFGKGHKVVTGYDFVNGDADPMDDNGHGTHVAGIVAADGAVRGVAPDARLTAYKVTNSGGRGQLSDILAGLDAAVDPANPYRADVVNMSLSGPGDGSDPLAVAASQAVDAGVVVASSAGNAGPGAQTVRSPAAGDGVLAVGASASGVWVPRARMVEPAQQDLRAVRYGFSADPPARPVQADVVDIGTGQPGAYEDVDVAGKAVLIHHNTANALEKAAHAEGRGAVAVFFYFPDTWGNLQGNQARPAMGEPAAGTTDHVGDAFAPGVDDGRLEKIMVMHIPGASASTLQTHLTEGTVTVEIEAADATDQLPDFSSRGPSGRFTAKPDLVAPGVEVLSTLPDGSYGRGSGTSMAAPHVAGAAALVRQIHPDWTAAQVSAALAGSAHRLDGEGPLDQGAGRLDALAAAQAGVVATPSSLSFGLADLARGDIARDASLTLSNLGGEPATVSLAVERDDGGDASVIVEPGSAQLAPGEATTARVRVELPTPDADRDVSGWVAVDVGDDGTTDLSVPFLLAVRHLTLHPTPDPAPEGSETAVFVRSPAELSAPPALEITCPGTPPQRLTAEPFGTRLWRATVQVGDAGLCQVRASGVADSRYGSATITGFSAFESAAAADGNRGAAFWQSVGPNAEAGWLAFGNGRTRLSAAIVPIDGGRIFVTRDGMRSWREVRTMPIAAGQTVGIAEDPSRDGSMYVAVNGRRGGDPSYRGRVLLTEDSGATWQALSWPDAAIDEIALSETGEFLAVAGEAGLRVTGDRGATWTELPSVGSGVRDLHWIGRDLYAATNNGLVVVRDAAGREPAAPEVLFEPEGLGWAGEVAGDAETLLVSRWPSPWLYASTDGGVTFELVLQRTGISFMDVELFGDDIYALQPSDLWVGTDRGAQWESWGDPQRNAIEFDVGRRARETNSAYVASQGAGLYTADEPDEYRRVGIPGAQVFAVTTTAGEDGEMLVAGTVRDTFRTTLSGRETIRPRDLEWVSSGGEGVSGAEARFLAASPADPSVVYKVRTDFALTFGIYRSDDGGATWERKSSPSELPISLLVHPANPDRVYVGYASLTGVGLVVSADGGETWRKIDTGRVFQALAGDPTDPDRIWAGDSSGLYLSEDAGLSFRRLSDVPVTAIAVDPEDPRRLVVGGRGLFTSDDGGATLRPAQHVDLDMWVTDILFGPGNGDRVFAATTAFYDELGVLKGGRGVLASEDNGATWESFSHGLGNPEVTSLALDRDGRHLFAGTFGGSVHRIKLSAR